MKNIIFLIPLVFASCAPVQEEKHETKYPDVPTMQSAEDANTGKLFND
jgi:hypothetical protein